MLYCACVTVLLCRYCDAVIAAAVFDVCATACVNLMGSAYCEPRAVRGDCETDPDLMVLRCRRACHACPSFGLSLHLLAPAYLLTRPSLRYQNRTCFLFIMS